LSKEIEQEPTACKQDRHQTDKITYRQREADIFSAYSAKRRQSESRKSFKKSPSLRSQETMLQRQRTNSFMIQNLERKLSTEMKQKIAAQEIKAETEKVKA
jgi:hypothetical protein